MALNPLLARFAGSRYVPLWALIFHRGRRSGRVYSTPIAARRTAEGFVIPLAFGETSDWCRNVLASGRAEIRWKDRIYQLDDPVLVDIESEMAAFPAVARPLLRLGLFGEHVLRLREVTSADVPSVASVSPVRSAVVEDAHLLGGRPVREGRGERERKDGDR